MHVLVNSLLGLAATLLALASRYYRELSRPFEDDDPDPAQGDAFTVSRA